MNVIDMARELLQSGDGGIAAGQTDQPPVHLPVLLVNGQEGTLFSDVKQAQQGREQLGRCSGQGGAGDAQIKDGHHHCF